MPGKRALLIQKTCCTSTNVQILTPRYSVYLLYWCNGTHTDSGGAAYQKHSLPPLPANQLGEMRGALCDIGVLKGSPLAKGKRVYALNIEDKVVQGSLEHLAVYANILRSGQTHIDADA